MRVRDLLGFFSMKNLYNLDFWASFENTDPTPISNPYTTYSGHLMDVTQSASQLDIIEGNLKKIGAGAISSNILKSQNSLTRNPGICINFRFKYSSASTCINSGFYQTTDPSHTFYISSNVLYANDRFSGSQINFVLTQDTWYDVFIVLRSSGAFWFIRDDINYYLFYVSSRYNFSTLYRYASLGATSSIDWIREKQLTTPFDTDWGFVTDEILSANNGDTFEHSSSCWIVFYLQTKASSGLIEIRFRIQDSSNYIKLTIDSSNVGRLYKTVAGVDTQLGSNATMGQAAEYRIFINGSDIRLFSNLTTALIISGTASEFLSEIDGEVTSQGTGGDISYLRVLPFSITQNDIVSQFEEMIAIPEPPYSGVTNQSIWISTNGSGDGTENNPYSFEDGINNLGAGTTVYLKGGTYSNKTISIDASGTTSYPIVIKPAPNEHVIIDSVGDFTINGSDVQIDGSGGILEIMTDSWTGDRFLTSENFDFNVLGVRSKIINCIIHDFGNVGFWSPSVNSVFAGNVVYNIGRGNGSQGHPLYTQNNSGTKTITNNIFAQTFESAFSIHQYGSGISTLKGYNYSKNIAIGGRWLCGSAASKIEDLVIDNNVCYPFRIEIGLLGATDPLHSDFQIINNRLRDITIKRGADFIINGNTVIGTSAAIYTINNTEGTNTIEDNDYIYYGASIPTNKWQKNAVNYSTLSAWQSGTGHDDDGTYTAYPSSVPPDFIKVYPNEFKTDRANIWIENYSGAASVQVDLSSVTGLVNGQTYRFYNGMNFAEYHEFTYNGTVVTLPMTSWTMSVPIGTSGGAMTPPPTIYPTFGVFYLMKTL